MNNDDEDEKRSQGKMSEQIKYTIIWRDWIGNELNNPAIQRIHSMKGKKEGFVIRE